MSAFMGRMSCKGDFNAEALRALRTAEKNYSNRLCAPRASAFLNALGVGLPTSPKPLTEGLQTQG